MANAQKKAKGKKGPKGQGRDRAPAMELTLVERTALDVASASAIAPLRDGFALVIDDDAGIYRTGGGEGAVLLRGRNDAKGLGDLESVCVDDDGKVAYAISEDRGQVFAFDVERDGGGVTLSEPRLLGVVARPGDAKNKGWEGAAFLAGSPASKGAPCLVLAHERTPKAIGVFTLPELGEVAVLEMSGALADLLDDVADVAVCKETGHLFLLSDQSQRIVEAKLHLGDGELELVGAFDLDDELDDDEKPEGIAFESRDRLVVVTDGSSRLLRYALER